MFKLVLVVLTSAFLSLTALPALAQADSAQVTGSVTYRERMALPNDAVIDVQLIDTSIADIAAQTVAESLINAEGRQVPVSFTLAYNPTQIVAAHHYSVRSTIRSGDGMLMFSTTQAYPVLTHGASSKVNLILHTVGHGPHAIAPAKKQAARAASETQASSSLSPPPTALESAPPATQPSGQAPPNTVMPNAQGQEKAGEPTMQKSETPVVVEPAPVPQTSSTIPESVPQTKESTPSETAPPVESASQSTPPQGEPTSTVHAATTPPATEQTEPKLAEAPAVLPEQPTPAKGKPEPTPTAPEAEPAPTLPEAPSATRSKESTISPPEEADSAADSEAESTSRPERPAPAKALTPLADTQWRLVQLGGQDIVITPPQKPMTLAFSPEGRRIAGSAGCNSYIGTFADDRGALHLNPGSMTLMSCADPAGSREKEFVAMLRSADGYKINGDALVLTSHGKTVAKFKINSPL